MKISLRNIAKVKEADIEIKGITVIAGHNDTGKSTVGKALFAVFNSFCNIDEKIINDKVITIRGAFVNNIESCVDKNNSQYFYENYSQFMFDIADEITAKLMLQSKLGDITTDNILHIIGNIDSTYGGYSYGINFNIDNDFLENINEIIKFPSIKFYSKILQNILLEEFSNNINNIYTNENGNISLSIKDNTSTIKIFENTNIIAKNILNIKTEAIYFDNPLIIDVCSTSKDGSINPHSYHLLQKISVQNNKLTVSQSLLQEQKLESVYAMLKTICYGDLINQNKKMTYKPKNSDKELNLKSLSSGLKTFVIIQQLLLNGSLERNGVLILDEPEIHLHPEWQLVFAELMVLLQKHFNLHILLTTHSPYFLRAIQVYAAKHEIHDVCKYYMSRLDEQNGRDAYIDDMTGNTRPIFASLARPFQTLEDEKWDL